MNRAGTSGDSFVIGCSLEIFSEDEIEFLDRYRAKLHSLGNGDRAPQTDDQRRFVEVVQGVREPESKYEKTWSKYLQRLELENDPENRAWIGPRREFHNDRHDWKRMRAEQWSEMTRRARGFDD